MEIRVLRILEYTGDAEAIMRTIEKNAVKGSRDCGGLLFVRQYWAIPQRF